MCFSTVPHWHTEDARREPRGDRGHGHAARFPAPPAGRDTRPGGETQVQQFAGQQELPYTRSSSQAQLYRLARRSDRSFHSVSHRQKPRQHYSDSFIT